MRIAFFGFTLNVPGAGARQYSSLLAKAMLERGHEVSIITSAGDERKSPVHGVRYVYLADRRLPSLFKLPRFVATAVQHFVRHRNDYDLIHCVSGYHSFAIIAQVVRTLVRTPMVYTVLAECDHPWLFRGFAPLICVSKFTRRKFAQHQTVLIPTAVNSSQFGAGRQTRNESFVVGTMGSTAPRRGIRHLVQAIPEILKHHPKTRFRLAIDLHQPGVAGEAGINAEISLIRNFIVSEKIADSVSILGEVDVTEFLASLDAFVYPVQTTKGMVDIPPTLLECLAAGVAIVTTRKGGIPEVLIHERNALLVELGREAEPKAYATLISRLIEDRHLREHLVREGIAIVRGYDIQAIAPRIESVYYSALSSRKAAQ